MKKVIFIQSHNGGRLANQLWNFVSIYAYCLEKGYLLVNPTFAEYSKYFEEFKNNGLYSPSLNAPKILGKSYGGILMKILLLINKIIPIGVSFQTGLDSDGIILPPTNPDFKPRKPILFFNGWLFRNQDGIDKYRSEIAYKFRPTKEYQDIVDNFYGKLPSERFKIAIHIRRTDYKDLFSQHYYEIDQYTEVIKKLQDKYQDKKPIIIIFSDEARNKEEFKDIKEEDIIISNNPFIADLFLISKCDLIVGPPSTFSQFAAWLGKKRLNSIEGIENFTP